MAAKNIKQALASAVESIQHAFALFDQDDRLVLDGREDAAVQLVENTEGHRREEHPDGTALVLMFLAVLRVWRIAPASGTL